MANFTILNEANNVNTNTPKTIFVGKNEKGELECVYDEKNKKPGMIECQVSEDELNVIKYKSLDESMEILERLYSQKMVENNVGNTKKEVYELLEHLAA